MSEDKSRKGDKPLGLLSFGTIRRMVSPKYQTASKCRIIGRKEIDHVCKILFLDSLLVYKMNPDKRTVLELAEPLYIISLSIIKPENIVSHKTLPAISVNKCIKGKDIAFIGPDDNYKQFWMNLLRKVSFETSTLRTKFVKQNFDFKKMIEKYPKPDLSPGLSLRDEPGYVNKLLHYRSGREEYLDVVTAATNFLFFYRKECIPFLMWFALPADKSSSTFIVKTTLDKQIQEAEKTVFTMWQKQIYDIGSAQEILVQNQVDRVLLNKWVETCQLNLTRIKLHSNYLKATNRAVPEDYAHYEAQWEKILAEFNSQTSVAMKKKRGVENRRSLKKAITSFAWRAGDDKQSTPSDSAPVKAKSIDKNDPKRKSRLKLQKESSSDKLKNESPQSEILTHEPASDKQDAEPEIKKSKSHKKLPLERPSSPPTSELPKPKVEKNSPVVEKNSPVVEKNSPVVEKNSPVVERKSPTVERKEPNVEKKQPVEDNRDYLAEIPKSTLPNTTTSYGNTYYEIAICAAGEYALLEMYEDSLTEYKKALNYSINDSKALNGYATVLTLMGKFHQAEILYQKLLIDDPNNRSILNNLAICIACQGNIESSKSILSKMCDSSKDALEPNNNLAVLHHYQGNLTDANRYLQHILKKSKEPSAEILNNIGVVAGAMGSFQESLDMLSKSIDKDNNFLKASTNKSLLDQVAPNFDGQSTTNTSGPFGGDVSPFSSISNNAPFGELNLFGSTDNNIGNFNIFGSDNLSGSTEPFGSEPFGSETLKASSEPFGLETDSLYGKEPFSPFLPSNNQSNSLIKSDDWFTMGKLVSDSGDTINGPF